MQQPRRLFLIDGSALAHRGYFAFVSNPLTTSDGLNTSAAFGFTRDLLRILDRERPDLVAVAFDVSRRTFRRERYADYKATRARMPSDMADSLPYIDQIVDALGVTRLGIEGYEADDVIATLARRAADQGIDVFVVSGDKDFCQLVTPTIRLYNPFRSDEAAEIMGPAEVEAKHGVPPERFRDYLALIGDASDNVPGVPGVGPKRAKELIDQFGDLQSVLDRADEYSRAKIRDNLKEYRARALLSQELVTLEYEAPVEVTPDDLVRREVDRATLSRLFSELELREFLKRFAARIDDDAHTHHLLKPADLPELLQTLRAADEVVFDLETTGLDPHTAKIVGMAFAVQPGEAYYLPAEERLSAASSGFELFALERTFDDALQDLKPWLEDPDAPKGGQNLKYDRQVLAAHGIDVHGVRFDTLLESYLLDPNSRHSLDDLALRYLGYQKITTREVLGSPTRTMDQAPDRTVFPYASEDADITLRLHRHFTPRLAEHPTLERLYRDVELPLVDVLAQMERNGITVDRPALAQAGETFQAELDALSEQAHELAGKPFNLVSPKQVAEVLYDTLELHKAANVRLRKTPGGAPATDAAALEELTGVHPLPGKILEYRTLEKLLNSYVHSLPQLVRPNGRVHPSFNQAATATGRLSCSEPNLQNIPIRTEQGRRIRAAFTAPEPGWVLLSADYSQVELRILAHMAEDAALIDIFQRGEDVHRATAARVFGVAPEAVTSEQRGRAKAINFGIVYGMGAPRLARQTDMTLEQAEAFIANYFASYPQVEAWLEQVVESARRTRVAETLLGRQRPLPTIRASQRRARRAAERIAVNTPIQGTAADVMKLAMLRADRALRASQLRGRMLLQVHDELVFETPEDEVEPLTELVREAMSGAFALSVPLEVEVGTGWTWLDAH